MIITPEQIKSARYLPRIEAKELARRAQVTVATIREIETVDGLKRVLPATLEGVRHALEDAGAEFIDRGVRRRTRTPEEIEARIALINEISERGAAKLAGHEIFTDDDLYDENGLPA